jgi:hypothetical protein
MQRVLRLLQVNGVTPVLSSIRSLPANFIIGSALSPKLRREPNNAGYQQHYVRLFYFLILLDATPHRPCLKLPLSIALYAFGYEHAP